MKKVISINGGDFRDIEEADLIEVREDFVQLSKIKKPLIYKVDKGSQIDENLTRKASYVDVEIDTSEEKIKNIKKINPKIKLIISFHDYSGTPKTEVLKKHYKKMIKMNPDIVKFATKANYVQDSFRMLEFLTYLQEKKQNSICVCMGEKGVITRMVGHLFGNKLMYFGSSQKTKTAEGQLTIKEFKSLYPWDLK